MKNAWLPLLAVPFVLTRIFRIGGWKDFLGCWGWELVVGRSFVLTRIFRIRGLEDLSWGVGGGNWLWAVLLS
jgi:hypothetical protein